MCCFLVPPIPIGSEEPLRKRPTITYSLLAVEAGVFVVHYLINILAVFDIIPERIPQRVMELLGFTPDKMYPWSFLTYAFLHDGWFHLLGNLLSFWIFGSYLEQRLGRKTYLAVIVFGSVSACVGHDLAVHLFGEPGSGVGEIPLVGASGFITAIMGAFVVLLPLSRVRCFYAYLILLHFESGKVVLPAFIYIPVFVFLDDLLSLTYYGYGTDTEVGYGAHLGGAAVGLAFGAVIRLLSKGKDPWNEEEDEISEAERDTQRELLHTNIRKALASHALEPALALIREGQKQGYSIDLRIEDKIRLAMLFEQDGQTGKAIQSYRNLMNGQLDFDQRLEIGLRLAKILLEKERDLEATKNVLRDLYQKYRTDPRLPRIQELIEQVKQTEKNLFKRPR